MDSKTTETEERTKSKTLVSYSHPQHRPLCQTDSLLRRDLQISQCNLSAYKAYLFWRNFKGFGFLRINSYECQMQIQKNQREFSFSTSCREKAQEIFHPLKTLWKNSYGLSCACILIPPFFLFPCVKIPPKTNRLLSSFFFLQLETCIHLSNHNFFQKKEKIFKQKQSSGHQKERSLLGFSSTLDQIVNTKFSQQYKATISSARLVSLSPCRSGSKRKSSEKTNTGRVWLFWRKKNRIRHI